MRSNLALGSAFRWAALWRILVFVLASSVTTGVAESQVSDEEPSGNSAPSVGVLAPGVRIRIAPTTVPIPPTAEQLDLQRKGLDEEKAPTMPTFRGPFPLAVGEPTPIPDAEASEAPKVAPSDHAVFRTVAIPNLGQKSGVDEPSVDGSGKMQFLTGNWYAARSANNGSTWSYINPYANYGYGTSFCCDQLTVYDAGHDRQFWLRQYSDHLEISNSAGKDLTRWCTYAFRPGHFELPTTYSFDYNHLALSTGFLYVSTNVYSPSSFVGSLIFRIPLQEQIGCSSLSFSYFGPRGTEFANAFVNGASDAMYWGTNAVSGGLTSGSGFRVFHWSDDGNTVTWFDRSIAPYNYMNFNGSQNCASASGAVVNWCQRTDSRMTGNGYISFPSLAQTVNEGTEPNFDAVIGFAFNANADSSHGRPYIRRVYFRASDMAYLGRSEIWNNDTAFLYPDMAPNSRGHVGLVWAWGGGGGSTNYYPGYGVMIDDDINQTQPWSSLFIFGSGNACLNTADSLRRWGDYLSIHALNPSRLAWIATGFRMNNPTNCTTGTHVPQLEVKTFIFGRGRDTPAYTRATTY